jgi:hypothetical protein
MSSGATISIMTLLATVEASGVHFTRCCIWSGWGSLSTLIPSVWSLKKICAWNHLLLRGDKSLSSRLRHRLRTLCDGRKMGLAGEKLMLMWGLELVFC